MYHTRIMSFDDSAGALLCPACREPISAEHVNTASDTAVCHVCGTTYEFSGLVEFAASPVDLNKPPAGAWYRQHSDGFTIGASMRSPFILCLLVPFTIAWFAFALGFVRRVSAFGNVQTIFAVLVGVATATLLALLTLAAAGKVEIRKRGGDGEVFTGVGVIGWTRRFRWPEIQTIRQELIYYGRGKVMAIVLEGNSRLMSAVAINDSRRHFLVNGLRRLKYEGALR